MASQLVGSIRMASVSDPLSKFTNGMIALVVATLAAMVIMLFSVHVRAAPAPQPLIVKCESIDKIKAKLQAVGAPLGHIRAVAPERMNDINDLYTALTNKVETPPWDTAYLMDGPEQDGFLAVGHAGKICLGAYFKAPNWRPLVKALEGQGV